MARVKKITEEQLNEMKKNYHSSIVEINGEKLLKLNETLIAYQTIDEKGNNIYENNIDEFPNSCSKKYIEDCIELNEKNLGEIKKVNWQYMNDDYFTVADIETTGFSPDKGGRIIEIGAVKIDKDGNIVDKFSEFVNPGMKITKKITDITSITNEMVEDADYVGQVISRFWDFIRGTTMVFHNAAFDWDRFLLYNFSLIGLNLPHNYPCLDTLEIDKVLFPNEKKHTLDQMCERLNVVVENHHRAIYDAEMTAKAFIKLRQMSEEKWKFLKNTVWNDKKPSLDIKIMNVKFWGKFKKKDGTMLKGRQYVKFVCNGFPGDGYFDILENAWYMKACKFSFKAENLEEPTLKFMNMNMEDFKKSR